MQRIAIGLLQQETNLLSRVETQREDYEAYGLAQGRAVIDDYGDTGELAGVLIRDTTIVLVEKTGPGSTPLVYEAAGCDPRDYKIVLAKSPEGFRQDYEPCASGILYAAAPGAATPFISDVAFENVHRPLFPLDDLAAPTDANWARPIYEKAARK